MATVEKSERISGAALLSVPAFDFFVWFLDSYGRLDLAVKLHEALPPFLLSPATGFICMCVGLGLLYLSQKRYMARIYESARNGKLLDSTGTTVSREVKLLWPRTVGLMFLIALVAAPILGIVYSLAYKGTPPALAQLLPPPRICKTADCFPSRPRIAASKPQPPTVINAPNGIAIGGGTVTNPEVNNFERPYRHLTETQKTNLQALANSLPADASFLHIEIVNEPETLKYGNEIADFFRSKTKTIGVGLSYPNGMPEGIAVAINSEREELFPIAQRIANTFSQSGIPVNFTKFANPKPGQIWIVIGVRSEH